LTSAREQPRLYWIVNTEYIPLIFLNGVHAQMRVVNTLSSY
jgi:hypothetical protein